MSSRPPVSLCRVIALTEGYRYDAIFSRGFVHRSRAFCCRPVPNPEQSDSQSVHRCMPSRVRCRLREPTLRVTLLFYLYQTDEHL